MKWFNYYGLIIMAVIMVPNIIFAVKNKNNFREHFNNPIIETVEQIGRYGCFIFMMFNVPCLSLGFFCSYAHLVYLSVNAILCFAYLLFWFVYRKKQCLPKSILLSVTPSIIFLFSGIVTLHIPLILFAIIFGTSHIYISYINAIR